MSDGHFVAPHVPEGIEASSLDVAARKDLLGLPKELADKVARHLVAAGELLDTDPTAALEHTRYARARAGRIAVVREAAGLTAYFAGEWSEAISDLRAVRRMTGGNNHLPVIADCERALGRAQRALDIAREARGTALDKAEEVELRIVAAGARRDLGQLDAAVVELQGPDLREDLREPWSVRLFYAYADNLLAAGRTEESISWFLHAAEADTDGETDAAERSIEIADSLAQPAGDIEAHHQIPAADDRTEQAPDVAEHHVAEHAEHDTAEPVPADAVGNGQAEPASTGFEANESADAAEHDAAPDTQESPSADSDADGSTSAT